MLVVNVNALRTVNGLYLFENIVLYAPDTRNPEYVLRVYGTRIEYGARFYPVARLDVKFGIEGKRVFLLDFARNAVADYNML